MNLRKIIRSILEENMSKPSTLAYHGSPHGVFDRFDISKRGEGADMHGFGDYGNGFYFTPDKELAVGYAQVLSKEERGNNPVLYTVKLNMGNSFNFDKLGEFQTRMNALSKEYGNVLRIPDQEIEKLYKIVGVTEEELDFIRDIESDIGDNWGDWDIAGKLKDNGYDSIISHNGKEYVVFDSSQIEIIKTEGVSEGVNEGVNLNERRVEHSDISDDLGLLIKDSKDWVDFTLYAKDLRLRKDLKSGAIIYGHIGISKLENGNWAVGGVAAEYGYGPLMYELAMSYVYPNALMPSRDGDVRSGAVNVWEKFVSRGDVKKEEISEDDSDFPRDYYEEVGRYENHLEYDFMFTRFYYNGAKDIFNKLLSRSNEYIKSGMDPKQIDRDGNEYWLGRYD